MRRLRCLVAAAAIVSMAEAVFAHGYTIAGLEITHPAIMVPEAGTDCSCAHLRIRNIGQSTEYFLGARIAAGPRSETVLHETSSHGEIASRVTRLAIKAGETLDLSHGWCLFVSGIGRNLEPDMGLVDGQLFFERAGIVPIEFMIDPRPAAAALP